MVKYWNARRVRNVRARREKREKRANEKVREAARRHVPSGNAALDAERMLDALGDPTRRKMVLRLRRGGAMSLSKLIAPFHMTLPAGLKHLYALERAGLVTTHKRGRIRFCVFHPPSLKSLAVHLTSRYLTEK